MIELNHTTDSLSMSSLAKNSATALTANLPETMTSLLAAKWLGHINFDQAFLLQKAARESVGISKKIIVFGLEHEDVVTLGRRAEESAEVNQGCSLPVVRTERGGLATLHSKGQLVIYPILNINEFSLSVKDWICLNIKVTRKLLQQFSIDSDCTDGVGLYTKNGKIAFLGMRIENGISTHGLAINVENDLSLFKNIKACGVQNQKLDKLSNYLDNDRRLSLNDLFDIWIKLFKSELGI